MVVYVEAVIFDNFCLDALLAYATLSLTKGKTRLFPILLSALVGTVVALFSPLVPDPFSPVLKMGTLFLSTALFSLRCPLRRYCVNTFVYAVLSFFLCGLLSFLLGSDARGLIGVSFGGAVGAVALAAILALYAVRQIRGLIEERKSKGKHVVAEVVNRDRSVRLNALLDSGNLLTDRNGAGVVVTDRRHLAPLGDLPRFGEMTVRTASGSCVLPLVKLPEIKIYSGSGENILTNVTAALSDLPDEYALILPCE